MIPTLANYVATFSQIERLPIMRSIIGNVSEQGDVPETFNIFHIFLRNQSLSLCVMIFAVQYYLWLLQLI